MIQSVMLAFEKILRRLDVLEAKLSKLPVVQLTCNDKLALTLWALKRLGGEATASQVSGYTGRARAVESHYLTLLCGFGVAAKRRVGRLVVYSLTESGHGLFGDGESRVEG